MKIDRKGKKHTVVGKKKGLFSSRGRKNNFCAEGVKEKPSFFSFPLFRGKKKSQEEPPPKRLT